MVVVGAGGGGGAVVVVGAAVVGGAVVSGAVVVLVVDGAGPATAEVAPSVLAAPPAVASWSFPGREQAEAARSATRAAAMSAAGRVRRGMVLGSLADTDAREPSARGGPVPHRPAVPSRPHPDPAGDARAHHPRRTAPTTRRWGTRPGEGAATTDATADRMLAAARQGSNRAWAALLERLDPDARLLAHLVLGGLDVDATLQSAYVRAYRARRKGPDDAVVMVLNHVWITCGHEIRRRHRREAPAPGRRPQVDTRTTRLGGTVDARTLSAMRPEERAVWALVHRAELPVASVAAALGVGEPVVNGVADRVAVRLDEARTAPEVDPAGGDDDQVAPGRADGAATADDRDDVPAPVPDEVDGADEGLEADAAGELGAEGTGDDALGATAAHDVVVDLSDGAPDPEPEGADGDAAGSLDPEPATPAFWQELGRRLKVERDAVAAAPPPSLPDPDGPSPALTPAQAPPVAVQKRASRRIRRRRPDLVEELAEEAGRQRARRSWPGLLVRVAAVLVVVAILAAAVYALYDAASTARSPIRGDSTADVALQSMGVLAEAGTWSATIDQTTVDDAGESTDATLTITAAQDGSFRFTDESIDRLTTYDAAFGVVRDTIPGFPPRNDQGVAPGGPDPSPPRAGLPLDDLATAARVLSTQVDDEPEVSEADGGDVRTLTGPLDDSTELTYVVDDETLLPISITWIREGETIRELRFRDVVLGVGGASYTQELPADAPPAAELGFLPVQLGEVQARTGIAPLTPDYLPGEPDGFEFTGAYVDEAAKVASLRYADGPQEMIITVRPSPVEAGQTWTDPFDRADQEVTPEEVTLDSGAFRDVPAQMVAGGAALPSIWAADGELAFTVAGDLSAEDLQKVAASLG